MSDHFVSSSFEANHDVPCFGIIVADENGCTWHNQTGGYACHHRAMRGQFFSLNNCSQELKTKLYEHFSEAPHHGWCSAKGESEGEQAFNKECCATFIDLLFATETAYTLRVDKEKLHLSEEAWVYMTSPDGPAVLVWENSD